MKRTPRIPRRLVKIVFILVLINLYACGTLHNVTSNRSIQKRKYNHGWFIQSKFNSKGLKSAKIDPTKNESVGTNNVIKSTVINQRNAIIELDELYKNETKDKNTIETNDVGAEIEVSRIEAVVLNVPEAIDVTKDQIQIRMDHAELQPISKANQKFRYIKVLKSTQLHKRKGGRSTNTGFVIGLIITIIFVGALIAIYIVVGEIVVMDVLLVLLVIAVLSLLIYGCVLFFRMIGNFLDLVFS